MSYDNLQSLLGWSALINILLITVWFVMFRCYADKIYRLHSRWFSLSESQFASIHYSGMAILKILNFMFFVAPWLAMKIISG